MHILRHHRFIGCKRKNQKEIDDDSKELLTINTHRELYRSNGLTPGVKSSPRAFQELMNGVIAATVGYSQIEKEGLAMIFVFTKFHSMILGRKFKLQTDHQSLMRI